MTRGVKSQWSKFNGQFTLKAYRLSSDIEILRRKFFIISPHYHYGEELKNFVSYFKSVRNWYHATKEKT